jgi:phage terminase large subunit-like protein
MTNEQHKIRVIKDCYEDLTFLFKILSPKTFYLESPDFHYELDEVLLDNSKRQVLREAPRGTSKTTKIISKIVHHGVFEKCDKLVVIQSKTRSESLNRITTIKNTFEYSQVFRDLFDPEGLCTSQNAEVWREDKIIVKIRNPFDNQIYRMTIKAIGTGQQVRGALEDSARITLYLLDDPDDENSCATKEQMDKNFDRFLGGIAGLDMRNGRVIVIGTPIREGCIVSRLRGASGWDTKVYPAYTEEDGQIKLLWGAMYSYEWLMNKKAEMKDVGKISKFYSEYMCEIVGEEDQLFKPEYWEDRRYTGHLEVQGDETYLVITRRNNVEVNEKISVFTYLGVDPASSTKQTADYFVVYPVAMDSKKDIYCLPYFRGRVTPLEGAEKIINKIREVKPKRGGIETTGYQEMLRQYIKERMMEEDVYCAGFEQTEGFKPKTEKSMRLEQLQPLFAQKKVWIMEEGMQAFIDELMMYPRGKNDDLLDGIYYATRRMYPPDHQVTTNNLIGRDFWGSKIKTTWMAN